MVSFATQVQIRRGTEAENNAFTGAEGEVTMDLTGKTLRVHDGSTQGGIALINENNLSWVFPSSKYIDLELQASGSIYTAPANGWFALRKRSSSAGQAIELRNNTTNISIRFSYSKENFLAGIYIPAKKGDRVYYESESTNTKDQKFVFVYAEGEK